MGTIPNRLCRGRVARREGLQALHIASVFESAGEFDLIHNNFDFLPLSYSRLVDTPVVTTIHGFSSKAIVPVFERYNDIGHYVAISDADRHARLDYARHHPSRDRHATPSRWGAGDGGYLLFFGRIHPDKGTVEAIDVAAGVGMPLMIAGIVQDRALLRPARRTACRRSARHGTSARSRPPTAPLLGGRSALLHLVNFDEPFGFSVVEAMACGTPVIASPRGSMLEIVRHRRTVSRRVAVDEAGAAVRRLPARWTEQRHARRSSTASTSAAWSTSTCACTGPSGEGSGLLLTAQPQPA